MAVIMRLVQLADGRPNPLDGDYLAWFDLDAHDGLGAFRAARDPAHAMRFIDVAAAFQAMRQQSVVRPLRPDGQPNRPLMSFTVMIEPAPDGAADAER